MFKSRRYLVDGDEIVFGPVQDRPDDSTSPPAQFRFRIRADSRSQEATDHRRREAAAAGTASSSWWSRAPSPPPPPPCGTWADDLGPASVKLEEPHPGETTVPPAVAVTSALAVEVSDREAPSRREVGSSETSTGEVAIAAAAAAAESGTTVTTTVATAGTATLLSASEGDNNNAGATAVGGPETDVQVEPTEPASADEAHQAPRTMRGAVLVRSLSRTSDQKLDAADDGLLMGPKGADGAEPPAAAAAAAVSRDLSMALDQAFAAKGRPVPSRTDLVDAEIRDSHSKSAPPSGSTSAASALESTETRTRMVADEPDPDTTVEVPRSPSPSPSSSVPCEAADSGPSGGRPLKRARTSSVELMQVDVGEVGVARPGAFSGRDRLFSDAFCRRG